MTKEHTPVSREEEIARPLGRPLLQPEGLQTWEEVISLFRRHGLDAPPVRLRDELVGFIAWARYGERLHDSLAALSPVDGLGPLSERLRTRLIAAGPSAASAADIASDLVLAMTDDEVRADIVAGGEDPETVTAEVREIFNRTLSEATTDTGDRGRLAAKDGAAAPPQAPVVDEGSRAIIHAALCKYQLNNQCDEDGYGYPLVDLVTVKGRDIGDGQAELFMLADFVADALAMADRRRLARLAAKAKTRPTTGDKA